MIQIETLFNLYIVLVVQAYFCDSLSRTIFMRCVGRQFTNATLLDVRTVGNSVQCSRECDKENGCIGVNVYSGVDNNNCEMVGPQPTFVDCDFVPQNTSAEFWRKECPCMYGQPCNKTHCICGEGFTGPACENPPRDCHDLSDGLQYIYLVGDTVPTKVGSWNGRLGVYSIQEPNYKLLGDASFSDHADGTIGGLQWYSWRGLELVHRITALTSYEYDLLVLVQYYNLDGSIAPSNSYLYGASYNNFSLSGRDAAYEMKFDGITLKATLPSLCENGFKNGSRFITIDADENGCASQKGGASWYTAACEGRAVGFSEACWINGTGYNITNVYMALIRI